MTLHAPVTNIAVIDTILISEPPLVDAGTEVNLEDVAGGTGQDEY